MADTLAVVGRDAWIVAGPRYVIVGSPLTPDATNLPVRASFVPWLGGVLTERLVGEPGQVIDAAPGEASAASAMGRRDRDAPTDSARRSATRSTSPIARGTYFLTRGGRRVGALVVNASAGESVLDRYSARRARDRACA